MFQKYDKSQFLALKHSLINSCFQLRRSDEKNILLHNLHVDMTGTYTCEVSTEGTFRANRKQAYYKTQWNQQNTPRTDLESLHISRKYNSVIYLLAFSQDPLNDSHKRRIKLSQRYSMYLGSFKGSLNACQFLLNL